MTPAAGVTRRRLFPLALGAALPPATAGAISPVPVCTVFFDSGRADIGAEAETMLRPCAAIAGAARSIFIHALTDSTEAGDALAIARGMAVHGRLIALGVPADHITVALFAEPSAGVPTVPNTPEQRSRRVDVMVR